MATAQENAADDSTISFNLDSFFDPNNEELAELSENDIPDGNLLTLMNSVGESFSTNEENNELSKQIADNAEPQKPKRGKDFPISPAKNVMKLPVKT